jgi:hypothetical protein
MSKSVELAVGVQILNSRIHLLVHYRIEGAADLPPLEVPPEPGTARGLASHLLGAAAAVDPAGHQRILDEIGAAVRTHNLLHEVHIPPGKNH